MRRREFITLLGGATPVAESPAGYVDRILREADPGIPAPSRRSPM